ncbi:ABC transporter permease [Halomonadaceae bacterium KBTZ08]
MNPEIIENILFATIRTGTPLLLVGLGAMISERSGVLNLGQEGMILVGAVCAFIGTYTTQSLTLGIACGVLAGALFSLIFAFIAITLVSNQIATGLALTIFGTGLSAFLGVDYVGLSIEGLAEWPIPVLHRIPVLGKPLFAQDPLVYIAFALFILLLYLMSRTRLGLVIRAIGEAPEVAHTMGYRVLLVRYATVMFGGAMAGLAGAYLSLAYTPMWTEGMSAGRGWIALALVVFASWRTERVLVGAWLFAFASMLHLVLQRFGYDLSPNLLAMLPYLATIIALVMMMQRSGPGQLAPRSLGQPYYPQK